MHAAIATFASDDDGPERAVASLIELGFTSVAAGHTADTVLDTFDGRLHRAGWRLVWRERHHDGRPGGPGVMTDDHRLVLAGRRGVPAQVPQPTIPRFAGDLPAGPLRTRLAAITDVRALLPVIRLAARSTYLELTDGLDKAVVRAHLRDGLQADGRRLRIPWTIAVEELPGSGREADRARRALRNSGARQLHADTIDAAVDELGIDLRGWSGSPSVPLDPWVPAADGVRAVLANLAEAIAANWSGTLERTDPEFLHDVRVAVRRTRTILGRAKRVLPATVLDRARAQFAWWGTATGPGRDLDVHLIELDRTIAATPGGAAVLAPMRVLLMERRASAHDALAAVMRSPATTEQLEAWRTWLTEPMRQVGGADADLPILQPVSRWLHQAQARIVEQGRLIVTDSPAELLHDLRKDAKRLRYLMECYGSLLQPDARKEFVGRLRALQDNLGEHQDAGIQVDELRGIAHELHRRGAPADTLIAIGRLTEQVDQRRAAARTEFAERFAEYDTRSVRRTLDAALDAGPDVAPDSASERVAP